MSIDLDPKNILQWVKDGRVYTATAGALTTPEAGWATDLVRQTPIFYLRVPAGTVVVPILSEVTPEATGAAVAQFLVSTAQNDIGISNAVAATVLNLNSRYSPNTGNALAYATVTGATGTAPTNPVDVYREYIPADIDGLTSVQVRPIVYNPFQGIGTPVVVGMHSTINCYMVYYANGTSSTGFHLHTWAEFTYDEFYA